MSLFLPSNRAEKLECLNYHTKLTNRNTYLLRLPKGVRDKVRPRCCKNPIIVPTCYLLHRSSLFVARIMDLGQAPLGAS
jgi:hypothetical protein